MCDGVADEQGAHISSCDWRTRRIRARCVCVHVRVYVCTVETPHKTDPPNRPHVEVSKHYIRAQIIAHNLPDIIIFANSNVHKFTHREHVLLLSSTYFVTISHGAPAVRDQSDGNLTAGSAVRAGERDREICATFVCVHAVCVSAQHL